jgi:trehalose 6-phosphate phosphatase
MTGSNRFFPQPIAPFLPGAGSVEKNAGSDGTDIALFLDVDGTLLDIARTPGEVVVPASLKSSLTAIEQRLEGALALVSGRAIAEIDELFAPLRLRASGVHGAEMRLAPNDLALSTPDARLLPDELWFALQTILRGFPGTFAENKRFSFAVHYREAPECAPRLRAALEDLTASAAWNGTKILAAHFAYELKAPAFDKGKAIAMFMNHAPFRGRIPMFVGDDVTDEAGFATVSALGGVAYSVGQRRPWTSEAFSSPGDVRDWLSALANTEAVG